MNRVVQFQVSAHDPKRAAAFYEKAFGWNIQPYQGAMEYWFITTGDEKQPGINGGIMRHEEKTPNIINTIGVVSVDETLEKVAASGGTIARPKFSVPGMGYLAYIVDTEGNLFGVMQYDSSVTA
jgi:uncharacterized protein